MVVEFILKKKWDEILEHPQDRALYSECMEEMADLGEEITERLCLMFTDH